MNGEKVLLVCTSVKVWWMLIGIFQHHSIGYINNRFNITPYFSLLVSVLLSRKVKSITVFTCSTCEFATETDVELHSWFSGNY